MLLTVSIVGFPKCSLIAAVLMLCLMHQCADQYSSSQGNGDHRVTSLLKISKYSLLLGLRARPLSKCSVPWICVQTGGCSGSRHAFSLSASELLESSSQWWRTGLGCSSWKNGCRIVSCLIAKPSYGTCLADTYTIFFCGRYVGEWFKRRCRSTS